jgi:hypothetical protein
MSRLLLDTHCWLWLQAEPERFSPEVLRELGDPAVEPSSAPTRSSSEAPFEPQTALPICHRERRPRWRGCSTIRSARRSSRFGRCVAADVLEQAFGLDVIRRGRWVVALDALLEQGSAERARDSYVFLVRRIGERLVERDPADPLPLIREQ